MVVEVNGGIAVRHNELQAFAEAGGTLVLLDRASELATGAMGVGIQRIAVPPRQDDWEEEERGSGGTRTTREPLYAPGSIFRVLVDRTHPIAAGMPDTAAVSVAISASSSALGRSLTVVSAMKTVWLCPTSR